jgi:hypothetical protein
MSSEYQSAFFIVPSRIMNLPDLILSYLRVYETIFQFWNKGKKCYLSNSAIMERTNIKSESTIREAFAYFEKHNELKRKTVKGKRYLIQPEQIIELDDLVGNPEPVDNPVAKSTPPRRQVDAPPVAKSTHNNKNINKEYKREQLSENPVKKISKSYVPGDGWLPDESRMNDAKYVSLKCNISIESLIRKFRDYHKSAGTLSYDWNALFGLFLSREHTKSISIPKNEPRSKVDWFNNNH